MTGDVIKKEALERIKGIYQLSQVFNETVSKPHQERLLELMRSHIDEIEELAQAKNSHCLTETGDLLILCFELLLEGGADIDEVTRQCFGRYEKKLTGLIDEGKQ